MTIEPYLIILAKRWRLMLISFLVVGIAAYIGSRLMTPLYQSTALVQVTLRSANNQSDYTSLLASDELVQTEAQLATSDPVLREVASHFAGLTVGRLSNEVTTTYKLNTQLFEIDVVDPNPAQAAALANDVAATLIKQQLARIQQQNSQSQQQIQQVLDDIGKQIDATSTQITALQGKAGSQAQVGVLQGRLSGLQQRYSQWQASLAQLELTEAQSSNYLSVPQAAQPDPNPVRPNIVLNTAAGLLVGALLGIVLAVLFEQLDTRVRTPEALTQLFDWTVLATIWRASAKEEIINPTGRGAYSEAYRILRTNIGFSGIDEPLHSLMVTSALPRDGKSVIATNLAIFMARAGKTTLLVDADLRRPRIHDLFGLAPDKMGLSNAALAFSMPKIPEAPPLALAKSDMSGALGKPTVPITYDSRLLHPATQQPSNASTAITMSLEPFVHSVGVPNLWVMPSGPLPPNPSELLDSKAMERLFSAIANAGIEMVIFDTPPTLGLSDASILASKVDGVLVVVDITRARKKYLSQTKAALGQAGARVFGCVVNKQARGRLDASYAYYYYRGDEQDDKKKRNMGEKNGPSDAVNVFSRPEMQNGARNHSTQGANSPGSPGSEPF